MREGNGGNQDGMDVLNTYIQRNHLKLNAAENADIEREYAALNAESEKNAEIKSKNTTKMLRAASKGDITGFDSYIASENPDVRPDLYATSDDARNNALHFAVHCGQLSMVSHLIENYQMDTMRENNAGLNALHLAAKSGNPKMAGILIEKHGMNPTCKTSDGLTAFDLVENALLEQSCKNREGLSKVKCYLKGKEMMSGGKSTQASCVESAVNANPNACGMVVTSTDLQQSYAFEVAANAIKEVTGLKRNPTFGTGINSALKEAMNGAEGSVTIKHIKQTLEALGKSDEIDGVLAECTKSHASSQAQKMTTGSSKSL